MGEGLPLLERVDIEEPVVEMDKGAALEVFCFDSFICNPLHAARGAIGGDFAAAPSWGSDGFF